MGKSKAASIFLTIIFILFVCFFIVPMLIGLFISFTDWNGMSDNFNFVGFNNYIALFKDERFLNSFRITVLYAAILLLGCLLIGYISAKILSGIKCLRSVAFFLSFFPYVITPVIVCILWSRIYTNLLPLLGEELEYTWLSHNFLADSKLAVFAVSFVDLWMLIPYAMLLILSALNSIPTDLIEYTILEGVSFPKKFKYLELPHIFPALGTITTVIFSYAFTSLDTIMTLTAGGPGRSTETLYYLIYKNSTLEQRYGYGLAEGILVSILSILVFIICNKIATGKKSIISK